MLISAEILLAEEPIVADNQSVVVISNLQNVQPQLNKNTLRAIFSMHVQQWPNGDLVKVFVLEDNNSTHQEFVKNQLGVFPYQLRKNWDRLVYSGTGEAPILVKDIQQMKIMVANTKGSIGYIPSNYFDPSVRKLVVN